MKLFNITNARTRSSSSNKNGGSSLGIRNVKWLSFPYILCMIGFIILPLLVIIYYGLTTKDSNVTLDNIEQILNPINLKALRLSLELSLISTVICLLLAYPLAMILSKSKMKSNSFIVMIIILPMWMNFLLRTIAWQNILERTGIINTILNIFNLPTLNIINTPAAIVLGMVYNFLPFMILPIYNVLIKIDIDVVSAARDLDRKSVV